MLSSLRLRVSLRTLGQLPSPVANSRMAMTASYSTAFRPSRVVMTGVKDDADPTPNKARGGSEQSMPGEASGDDIANSEGAYDSGSTRPQESGKQIEKEKPADMDKSAASTKPADNATQGQSKQTSSQNQGGSKPSASGGTAVRGGNSG